MDKKTIFSHFEELIESIPTEKIDMLPSDYAQKFRTLTSDVSTIQGKFKYKFTPYLREIIDTLSPYHPAKIIAVMKGAQIGFALDIETLIPAIDGWKKMKDLQIGDKVFDEKGNITKITFVSDIMHDHKCYEIEFSDKSKIIADADHRWEVWDEKKYEYRKKKIINTEEISNTFKVRGNRNRYAVDNSKPLKLSNKKLLIHPYLLGLWLGDGNRCSNRITSSLYDSEELSNIIESFGESNIISSKNCPETVREIVLKRKDGRYKMSNKSKVDYIRFGERAEKLKIYRNKHIPDVYLRSSVKQRFYLLQGLMDSDGSITKKGLCEFYNTDKNLIDQVYELISSLGLKCTIRLRKNKGKKVEIIKGREYYSKDLYVINFYAYADDPVFRLKRKKERLNFKENTRNTEIDRRRIINVKKIDSVPVKCISVDSPSHLYLAGKTMIPTHNTEGVIVNGILWIIVNHPGNIMALAANDLLSQEMIESRLDQGIQSCGIQHLIRPNTIRKRNQRTGDTSKYKEFAGGRLFAGGLGSVDKLGKQRSIKYGFFDDWDAAEISDKQQGNIFDLLQQRFSTSANSMKQYYISTPQTKPSNIEKVYLKGDQRKWHIPCPKCKVYIELLWHKMINKKPVGVVFEKDDDGRLIEDSVGYVCQECGEFWDESYKYTANMKGKWIPTAKPERPGIYSYHISCITSAPNMYDWVHYAYQFLETQKDGRIIQSKLKVFNNLVLGIPWEEKRTQITSNMLSSNTRQYAINTVPCQQSKDDGNGDILLLTCSCDLNGTLDDARMDWEVMAHSASGSEYSVAHGSIGTFRSGRKKETNRSKWTYRNEKPDNVWDYFYDEIVNVDYITDDDRVMKIMMTGVDTGYYTHYAYAFIDSHPGKVIGLKGAVKKKIQKINVDMAKFKPASERPNLYILQVDLLKDELAEMMTLKWSKDSDMPQPPGFINFPMPEEKRRKYDSSYFKQYEAEEKKIELDDDGEPIGWTWERKHASAPNHFFDCAVYNLAMRKIVSWLIMKEAGKKYTTWAEFVDMLTGMV